MQAPWSDSEWLIIRHPLSAKEMEMLEYSRNYDVSSLRPRRRGLLCIGLGLIMFGIFAFIKWSVTDTIGADISTGPAWLNMVEITALIIGASMAFGACCNLIYLRRIEKFLASKQDNFTVFDASHPYWVVVLEEFPPRIKQAMRDSPAICEFLSGLITRELVFSMPAAFVDFVRYNGSGSEIIFYPMRMSMFRDELEFAYAGCLRSQKIFTDVAKKGASAT